MMIFLEMTATCIFGMGGTSGTWTSYEEEKEVLASAEEKHSLFSDRETKSDTSA
jgi:hypothetical protein